MHEREAAALEWLREALPDHEPWRGFTGFRLVDDSGTAWDIDALIISPRGVFVVEIKSWLGRLDAAPGHWTYYGPGGRGAPRYDVSPLALTERKAKKLASLLGRAGVKVAGDARGGGAMAGDGRTPWVDAVVFWSEGADVTFDAGGEARFFVRDELADPARRLFGIADALKNLGGPARLGRQHLRTEDARRIEAAIRPMLGPRTTEETAGDWLVEELIATGNLYEDRACRRGSNPERRRLRIFTTPPPATERARRLRAVARDREYAVLGDLHHEGILRVIETAEHPRGPAIVFDEPKDAVTLDGWLATQPPLPRRFEVLRAIGDALGYAHGRHVVHRALTPRAVLVVDNGRRLSVRVMNWHCAAPDADEADAAASDGLLGARGLTRLPDVVATADEVWLAPELDVASPVHGTAPDVWGLGALAAFVFTDRAPGANLLERTQRLLHDDGLSTLGVGVDDPRLHRAIADATCPDVSRRTPNVAAFVQALDDAQRQTTVRAEGAPLLDAQAGQRVLDGRFIVVDRIGSGATALALRVQATEGGGPVRVLKVARAAESNAALEAEFAALRRLHEAGRPHDGGRLACFVEPIELIRHDGLVALLLDDAGESLAARLQRTRLPLGELQVFGKQLLDALVVLERVGVLHRDLKPDNLGVRQNAGTRQNELVVFDFSLASARPSDTTVGTRSYRDPFLGKVPTRTVADSAADRYGAAATLFELATLAPPSWGGSDPATVPDATVRVDRGAFFDGVAAAMQAFFEKAFARDHVERHHTAAEMRDEWERVFQTVQTSDSAVDIEARLHDATRDAPLAQVLGQGMVLDWLQRERVFTLDDVLQHASRLRGAKAGLNVADRDLRDRFVALVVARFRETSDPGAREYDRKPLGEMERLCRDGAPEFAAVLGAAPVPLPWPEPMARAAALGLDPATWQRQFDAAREAWGRKKLSIGSLHRHASELIERHGGIVADAELADGLRARRGDADADIAAVRGRASTVAWVTAQSHPALAVVHAGARRAAFVMQPALAAVAPRLLDALGAEADAMMEHAEFVPAPQALTRLRAVATRALAGVEAADELLSTHEARLVPLAAAASAHAVLTADRGFRHRDLSLARAVALSRIPVAAASRFEPVAIREFVTGRFPGVVLPAEAPALEQLLQEAGVALRLENDNGRAVFVAKVAPTHRETRAGSSGLAPPPVDAPPVILPHRLPDAHARRGGWAVVVVRAHAGVDTLVADLCARFDLSAVDLDALVVGALQRQAASKNVRFSVVDRAAGPLATPQDTRNLGLLLGLARAEVAAALEALRGRVVLVNAGLFERFGWLPLLDDLRVRAGTDRGPDLAWLVLPRVRLAEPRIVSEYAPLGGLGERIDLTHAHDAAP